MSVKLDSISSDSEPPMYLQRPSSGRSQDISHVLATTFKELFTRDIVEQETVKNLNVSRSGDDTYHEKYVENLRKVQVERERRMTEAAMLERHIMQARARAMTADERELNRAAEGCDIYHELNLPPGESNYTSFLDSELLKNHHLIVPEDFSTIEPPPAKPPKATGVPHYAHATNTSMRHIHASSESFSFDGSKANLPIVPGIKRKSRKNKDRDKWKEEMLQDKREVDRTDLALLQHRSEFLRNPRFRPPSAPKGGHTIVKPSSVSHILGGAKSTVIDKKMEPSAVFVSVPEAVVFFEYEVGRVYEKTVELMNVSSASRQLRVIPPATSYFRVGLGKFPGEDGMVAPGMCAQYSIRFSPDSLMDYDDQIRVQSQSSSELIVKLLGRRPPPVLTLSPVMNCGHCLIGGAKTVEFVVKNEGGYGKFCIMPKEYWPTTYFKSSMGVIQMAPFEIRPAMFELPSGKTMSLEVVFFPNQVKTYSQEITIVCDNCHVKHFTITGEGQRAGVELAMVTDGEQSPLPGEICDVTTQHHIKFDTLNPMTYEQKQIVVKNSTNVELPFYWKICKPHLETTHPNEETEDGSISGQLAVERQMDSSQIFYIDPSHGVMPPDGSHEFTVTYAPPKLGVYHSVLQMILQQIPDEKTAGSEMAEQSGSSKSSKSERRSASSSSSVTSQDKMGLEVELKGDTQDYNVLVEPAGIFVPGEVLVTTTIRKYFQMANNSMSPVNFMWSSLSDCHIVEVEQPGGQILAGEILEMTVLITGSQPGKIDHTLTCRLENSEQTLSLRVQANFKGPEVVIETPSVHYGLVMLGDSLVHDIFLRNTSQIPSKWLIRESEEYRVNNCPLDSDAAPTFEFSPSEGVLGALGSVTVKAKFCPSVCKVYKSVFELLVEEGAGSYLMVSADVQSPSACLLSSQLVLKEVYVNIPIQYQVELLNKTLIETNFCWGEPCGEHASSCSISLEPRQGKLRARQKLTLNVNFISHVEGELSNVLIPCTVDGMEDPIYLSLFAIVKGLSVTYHLLEENQDPSSAGEESQLRCDFGSEVELDSSPKRFLHLTNNSAIPAPFTVYVDHFVSAKPPTPPPGQKKPTYSASRRNLVVATPEIADPYSKPPARVKADYTKATLRDGRGAAFEVQPGSGTLMPFGHQVVEVTAFSDMWGQYTDSLVCKVDEQEPVVIPVQMTVVGCPLSFQVQALGGQTPIVRYGMHISGIPPITRPMRINNNSPYDVRIDWELYSVQNDDPSLIDLLVTYGEAFPLRHPDGSEIVPAEDAGNAVKVVAGRDRFLCDTPDTSQGEAVSAPLSRASQRSGERAGEDNHPRVVRVRMREHQGTICNQPFNIQPRQVVVPAKNHVTVNASFTPYTDSMDESGVDCLGYALGHLSLDHSSIVEVPGYVARLHGYDVQPLKLDFTANVKPALLTVETVEDEGMLYHMAASNMMTQGGQVTDHYLKTHACTLTNMTETPLSFQLIANHPFVLVDMDPYGKEGQITLRKPGLQHTSKNFTLIPRKNLQVKVGFYLTMELVNRCLYSMEPEVEVDGVTLTIATGGERKIHFKQNLQMKYINGAIQTFPLYGTITAPSIVMSRRSLDFGVCLVGQQREQEIILKNPSGSDSYWTAVMDKTASDCEQGVFTVTPSQGCLDANITHVSNSKVVIKVNFTARHNVSYESVFVFSGILGEEPQKLMVRGQGSYDERHEALVNI